MMGNDENSNKDECKEIHIKTCIIKMVKVKEKQKCLKAARGKQLITYKNDPMSQADFSIETLQTRRGW